LWALVGGCVFAGVLPALLYVLGFKDATLLVIQPGLSIWRAGQSDFLIVNYATFIFIFTCNMLLYAGLMFTVFRGWAARASSQKLRANS
jgi:hypothetical protein